MRDHLAREAALLWPVQPGHGIALEGAADVQLPVFPGPGGAMTLRNTRASAAL